MLKISRNNLLIAAAVTLVFGAIGPWITVLGFIGGGPSNSLEVGLVVFGGIALVVASALSGRWMRPISIVVGLAVLAETIHVLVEINKVSDSDLVQTGWGLYLSILAALFLVASTWVAKKQES